MVPFSLLKHLNTLWPVLIVSELAKNGIDTYFVSPGNRNVPIMAALNAVDGVSVKFCVDERASAYRAIGHAKGFLVHPVYSFARPARPRPIIILL
jgi:2-succinyl-5-enolpyruvyl-6-hydroxy-3-cyclohexene-1-carboxylate synthase